MNTPSIDPQIVRWLNAVRDGSIGALRSEAPNLYLQRSSTIEGERLDSAICSHLEWRDKLEAFFADSGEMKLEASIVGRDDLCALGRWIHGEGRSRLNELPAFRRLEIAHAAFHRIVGDIVEKARTVEREVARARLNEREYVDSSWQVVEAISALVTALKPPA